jgi:hypothetical protein
MKFKTKIKIFFIISLIFLSVVGFSYLVAMLAIFFKVIVLLFFLYLILKVLRYIIKVKSVKQEN